MLRVFAGHDTSPFISCDELYKQLQVRQSQLNKGGNVLLVLHFDSRTVNRYTHCPRGGGIVLLDDMTHTGCLNS